MAVFPHAAWLLTPAQTKQSDQAYVSAGGDSWALMQAAGKAVADYVLDECHCRPVHVLCGPGQNGADGLVVAALLRAAGWPVSVSCMGAVSKSSDGKKAAALWGDGIAEATGDLPKADIYIDALFGAGLDRPLTGVAQQLVTALNASSARIIAIDIPSGIDGETGQALGEAVIADDTVTFFRAKIGHWLQPGRNHCGRLVLRDIGLTHDHLPADAGRVAINSPLVWGAKVPSLNVTHKYARGRLWVLGGIWMTGAAALAAGAGLRSGAGLVGIAATGIDSAAMYRHYERALLVAEAEEVGDWRALLHRFRPDALVMGPGLANQPDPMTWIKAGLDEVPRVVLDADGLNAFQNKADDLYAALGPNMVLTPHLGEFDRLFGDLKGGRVERALAASKRAGCTVVLKGNDTVIAGPDGRCLINTNAPVSLATAGTGDVLAGPIGALLARGMAGFDAASAGVWFHGRAAMAAGSSLIADDLLPHLSTAV